MVTLTGSIEADVPLEFADREWSEYVRRSLFSSFTQDLAVSASSITDTDADAGTVRFEALPDGRARVSVELKYTPPAGDSAGGDVARAQQRLERDLHKYRDYVLRRCEQEHCRAV